MGRLSRSTQLSDRSEHEWKRDEGYWWECDGCGRRTWSENKLNLPDGPCNRLKRTQVNPYNAERRARSRTEDGERHTYGDYFRWAIERRCCACGAYPCVPHHLDTVGGGGRDAENLIDCCAACHDQIETEGLSSWEREYGIDAEERAGELWAEYSEREAG